MVLQVWPTAVWYQRSGSGHMVLEIWVWACSTRGLVLVLGMWYQTSASGSGHVVPEVWFWACGTRYLVVAQGLWYQMDLNKHPVSDRGGPQGQLGSIFSTPY